MQTGIVMTKDGIASRIGTGKEMTIIAINGVMTTELAAVRVAGPEKSQAPRGA
jgi:hypothetical protein